MTIWPRPVFYFYPRSPCGERLLKKATSSPPGLFLSTLSLRRATGRLAVKRYRLNISIHALLAESDTVLPTMRPEAWISIHALLAESDSRAMKLTLSSRISIHALLAESDFLGPQRCAAFPDFYPRSPCGERRWLRCWQLAAHDISIHALLAESDMCHRVDRVRACISIHALLAESDCKNWRKQSSHHKFLSTLSLRRATRQNPGKHYVAFRFLSTLSLRRATCAWTAPAWPGRYFYPRSPCGERHRRSIFFYRTG